MKIIQTNFLLNNLNGSISDFQSCMYDVEMDWDDFKQSRKRPDISISDKVSNQTMAGIGRSISFLTYLEELNKNLINSDFHFEIIYVDARGGYTKSVFYKIGGQLNEQLNKI